MSEGFSPEDQQRFTAGAVEAAETGLVVIVSLSDRRFALFGEEAMKFGYVREAFAELGEDKKVKLDVGGKVVWAISYGSAKFGQGRVDRYGKVLNRAARRASKRRAK